MEQRLGKVQIADRLRPLRLDIEPHHFLASEGCLSGLLKFRVGGLSQQAQIVFFNRLLVVFLLRERAAGDQEIGGCLRLGDAQRLLTGDIGRSQVALAQIQYALDAAAIVRFT